MWKIFTGFINWEMSRLLLSSSVSLQHPAKLRNHQLSSLSSSSSSLAATLWMCKTWQALTGARFVCSGRLWKHGGATWRRLWTVSCSLRRYKHLNTTTLIGYYIPIKTCYLPSLLHIMLWTFNMHLISDTLKYTWVTISFKFYLSLTFRYFYNTITDFCVQTEIRVMNTTFVFWTVKSCLVMRVCDATVTSCLQRWLAFIGRSCRCF